MLVEFDGKAPVLDPKTYISENAVVAGNVSIGCESSVWFGAVVRGDDRLVTIGDRTNIQDNVTIHNGFRHAVTIGNDVTIGHNAIVHGCTVEDNVIIGMGAIVMDGAHVGKNSIIGAGALVRENMDIPEGSIVVGSPAKIVKQASEEQIRHIAGSAREYVRLAGAFGKWENEKV